MMRAGFFLVETIIYIAFFSLIVGFMLRATMADIFSLVTTRHSLQRTAQVNATLQRFMRDVHRAPYEKSQWYIVSPSTLIWKYDSECIGWMIEDGNLVRGQGNYDHKKGSWKKKTQSLALQKVTTVFFEIKENREYVQAVTINIIDNQSKKFSSFIALRNRIV